MGSVRYGGQGILDNGPMGTNERFSTPVLVTLPSLHRVNENIRT